MTGKMTWEVVIGLETHAQLSTASKIFSGASTAFGAAPYPQASAVDIALPGVLPVLNRGAVDSCACVSRPMTISKLIARTLQAICSASRSPAETGARPPRSGPR